MPNYSLNNAVPEPDRTLDDKGFFGMTYHENAPQVEREPTVPYNKPSPLHNEVLTTANTQLHEMFPPAGDTVRRTD